MRPSAVLTALSISLSCVCACGTATPGDDPTSTTSDSTPADDTPADDDSPTTDTTEPVSRLNDGLLVRTVIDGDTIEVLRNDEVLRVRFKGIDTPELYSDSGAEAFAQEARDFVWNAVGNSSVELQFDSDCGAEPYEDCYDGYERLLAYVRTEEHDDLAEALLRAGLANVYRFHNETFDRLGTYQAAEASAKRDNNGIWSN